MKINKYLGPLALTFALVLPIGQSSATSLNLSENKIYDINADIKTYPNFDKASKAEIEAYDLYVDQFKDLHKIDRVKFDRDFNAGQFELLKENFGKEYESRFKLAKAISDLEKAKDDTLKPALSNALITLNGSDINKIETLRAELDKIKIDNESSVKDAEILESSNIDTEADKKIEGKILKLMDKGILYEADKVDETLRLDLIRGAILNSKNYYQADEKTKEKYDELLEATSNTDSKVAYETLNNFVLSDDKENFDDHLEVVDSAINQRHFTAGSSNDVTSDELIEETSTIENPGSVSGTEASNSSSSESGFLKNSAISTKYNELSQAQQREVDAIDTNKDGKLSADELDRSANYTSELPADSWLYPFTEKAQSEESTQTSTDTNTQTQTEAPLANENEIQGSSDSSSGRPLPQTVTIDDKASKSPELSDEDKKDEAGVAAAEEKPEPQAQAPANTSAASVVKTGIKGLGLIVLVLALALGAYYFLSKDKKNQNR